MNAQEAKLPPKFPTNLFFEDNNMKFGSILGIFLISLAPIFGIDRSKEFIIIDNAKISKTSLFVIHEKRGDLHLSNLIFDALLNENLNPILLAENEQRTTDNKNDIDIKYAFTTAFTIAGFHKVFKNLDIRVFDKDKLIATYNYTIKKNKATNVEEIVLEFLTNLKTIIEE